MRQRITELEAQANKTELKKRTNLKFIEQTNIPQKHIFEPSESGTFKFPDNFQLREIFAFIEANYHQPITLNEVAHNFNYSSSYLTSLVRRLTGKTLYQWIVQRRMFQARCLLLSTNLSSSQIAETVGYSDPGHFIKHFHQLHGQPPKTWKNS